jgi:hypothetical protein
MSVRYVEMKEPIYDTISKRIRESFPNSCIVWIEENENIHLYSAYQARKAEIAKVSSVNEMQWFHGTREENITKIAMEGFDPAFNKTSAYGKGTYFARDASYSNSYMVPNAQGISFMFLCNVLMGKPCMGDSKLKIDTSLYHSAIDNFQRHSILVPPFMDAAYPKYIVAFHKNAT